MDKILAFLSKYKTMVTGVLISIAFLGVYILVYYTGGIKYVYSHSMYIPILLAGAFFGLKLGLLAGIIGGIILGPIMPLVVDPYEAQSFINWFFRLLVFASIGGLSGYFVDRYKYVIKVKNRLYSHHPDTDLRNLNYLFQLEDDYIEGKILIATVIVNNKDKINNLLGTDMYIKAMKAMFAYIKQLLPEENVIVQADSDKFWVMLKLDDDAINGSTILNNLNNQVEVDNINIYIDYSIGVSECHSFKECKTLNPFKASDQLADYAKSNSLPYVIYDQKLTIKKYEFHLLSRFSSAISNNETYLVYHPVIDANTKELIGFEALIRWDSPEYGLIMPNDFIPMVESTQLIHQMTDWVIRSVMQFQKRLIKEGYDKYISINLSGKNINNPNFFKRVEEILKEEGAIPSQIIFEVTETVLLEEEMKCKKTLQSIKNAGFSLAIDDFGKGYSSLSYLNQFKTDYLKIDKSYVDQMAHKESTRQILEAIIKVAHQFDLKVVAEGVESKDVFDLAKKLNIDYIQGFYITKPLAEDDIISWYHEYTK
ncbi:EAL domain-containing protein [Mycoplasmatota bacterium]|nr:EAL domain-containing protein [Mycoplasmatota bacterium]